MTLGLRVTRSHVVLAVGLLFFAIGTAYFHYEVRWKEPACSFDLLEVAKGRCDLEITRPVDVRIVGASGPVRGRKTVSLAVDLFSGSGPGRVLTLRPKSLSVDASGPGWLNNRDFSTSNYGILTVLPGEILEVSASESLTLELLRVEVHSNPRDWPIWMAYVGCVFSLLLAVRGRERMFLRRSTRWIPYTLVVLLGVLLMSWNL
jgi:hypothetical protein